LTGGIGVFTVITGCIGFGVADGLAGVGWKVCVGLLGLVGVSAAPMSVDTFAAVVFVLKVSTTLFVEVFVSVTISNVGATVGSTENSV